MNYVNLVLECSLILIRKISSKMSTVLNIFYPPIYIVYTIFLCFLLKPPKIEDFGYFFDERIFWISNGIICIYDCFVIKNQ